MPTQLVADAGLTCGRIVPKYWTPTHGTHVWCFGSDEPGYVARLAANEFVEISQAVNLGMSETPPIGILVAVVHVRCPAVTTGWEWVLYVGDNDVYTQTTQLKPECEYDLRVELPALSDFGGAAFAFGVLVRPLPDTSETNVETEVPAVYIDIVEQVADDSKFHVGFTPQNGETDVPLSGFTFRVVVSDLSVGPSSITGDTLTVLVNGAPAFADGWFVYPFDIGASYEDLGPTQVLHFGTRSPGFTSQQVVNVEVFTSGDLAHPPASASASWTMQDLTAPTIVGARALDLDVVRVELDEDVRHTDPIDNQHAVCPDAWIVRALEAPYFVPPIVSVDVETPRVFHLRFAEELSPGIRYTVTSETILDPRHNQMLGDSVASFVALYPETPATRVFDLYGMLTAQNRRDDASGDLLRFIACLQQVGVLLLASIDRWTDILDIDRADDAWLEVQLASLGNPFQFDLTTAQKRRLLRSLNRLYAEKGTDRGIINALAFFLGLNATVTRGAATGFSLGDCPLGETTTLGLSTQFLTYSFSVKVPGNLTDDQRVKVREIIDYMKPAWTHLLELVEPGAPDAVPDHWALGLSQLGVETLLH